MKPNLQHEHLQLEPSDLQQLLRQMYDISESEYKIGGHVYTLVHVTDGYALLDNAEESTIPYWAEVWPSSVALAEVLKINFDLKDKKVIELGAGLGLGSCVAAHQGASVVATDYLVEPLAYAKVNAARNSVTIEPRLLDWTLPLNVIEKFDMILAADVLYSESNVEPVARLLAQLLGNGGVAVLSDPQRNHLPRFLKLMEEYGCEAQRIERSVNFDGREVVVDVYVFSLASKALPL